MAQTQRVIREGSSPLRPRARLIQAIGEDLISNPTIALIELIKNAYDADADRVEIIFEGPLLEGKGFIVVRDNGHGMSLEVLETSWLQPATPTKKTKPQSKSGRRVTGEKGIGRFAAARLSARLHLDSVCKSRRIVADFNWESFKDESRFLDQIHCAWKEYATNRGTPSGTILKLEGLRDSWTLEDFRRLRAELSRLIARPSPTDPFEIEMILPPGYEEMAGPVTPPPVLGHPHYTMTGSMNASGLSSLKIETEEETRRISHKVRLGKDRKPECGPFTFDLKVWDRDKLDNLAKNLGATVRNLKRDLDEAAGVSLYRDSFRVLPYGGPQNDWLRLDLRRIQSPTMRLSNNQIVGAVYVTADANPNLRDQTNREGLVESPALTDLRDCIVNILAQLEKHRYSKRRKDTPLDRRKTLFEDFDLDEIKAVVKERYPADTFLFNLINDSDKQIKSSVKAIQEVIVRYRRLATLGQLIDVILHDGRTPVASISNESVLGQRDLQRAPEINPLRLRLEKRLKHILRQADVLTGLFKRISPFGGRKRGKPAEAVLEELAADAFAIFESRIKNLGVKISISQKETKTTIDTAEMQQIFVNLIDNALYWLELEPVGQREIAVSISRNEEGVNIIFSDNGPGVPEDVRDFIFEPYFSTKPEGIGLGLTIAGEIVAEYGGSLELISPGALKGANFRIILRRRTGSEEDAQ